MGQTIVSEVEKRDFAYRRRYRELAELRQKRPLSGEEMAEFWTLIRVCDNDAKCEIHLIRFMTGSPLNDADLSSLWSDFKTVVLSE